MAFVRGIHRWVVNSLHKGQVTLKMLLFDDVIMFTRECKSMIIETEEMTTPSATSADN